MNDKNFYRTFIIKEFDEMVQVTKNWLLTKKVYLIQFKIEISELKMIKVIY